VFQVLENSSQFWLVDRLHRQSRAGAEDESFGHPLADDLVHKRGVGCVAGHHRCTGLLVSGEICPIATHSVRAAGDERLHHSEPQPLAAACDDHTLSVQVLHAHSPLPACSGFWTYSASAACSAKDWTQMSMRIFDRAAGCDRNGEWLLSNVWIIVLPPMAPSTVAIM
jgi:hypothetical protein